MTEAYKQFECWFDEYSDKNDIRLAINYGAYEIAGDAWQHQQQRIEELEKKLAIVVDALKEIIAANNEGIVFRASETFTARYVANEALKQIEATESVESKRDALTEYYEDRNNSGNASLAK